MQYIWIYFWLGSRLGERWLSLSESELIARAMQLGKVSVAGDKDGGGQKGAFLPPLVTLTTVTGPEFTSSSSSVVPPVHDDPWAVYQPFCCHRGLGSKEMREERGREGKGGREGKRGRGGRRGEERRSGGKRGEERTPPAPPGRSSPPPPPAPPLAPLAPLTKSRSSRSLLLAPRYPLGALRPTQAGPPSPLVLFHGTGMDQWFCFMGLGWIRMQVGGRLGRLLTRISGMMRSLCDIDSGPLDASLGTSLLQLRLVRAICPATTDESYSCIVWSVHISITTAPDAKDASQVKSSLLWKLHLRQGQ
eukprot:569786-Rhodomonas_salina.1